MSYVVIIPARYQSTRLPGKPLLDIAGKPLIQHVYERAKESKADDVIIATDDERISNVAQQFGDHVCMTRSDHHSGTDRLQEVAMQLGYSDDTVIVNVQGDEPLVPSAVIDQVAENLLNKPQAQMATLSTPIVSIEELTDTSAVKVVTNNEGYALYFSRAVIPWARDDFLAAPMSLPNNIDFQRHIGIYAYRTGFLHDFVQWPPSPIEKIEHLEQLRALYYGSTIHVSQACQIVPAGVDTQEDLEQLREYFTQFEQGDGT